MELVITFHTNSNQDSLYEVFVVLLNTHTQNEINRDQKYTNRSSYRLTHHLNILFDDREIPLLASTGIRENHPTS